MNVTAEEICRRIVQGLRDAEQLAAALGPTTAGGLHPTRFTLLRFMRSEMSPAENRTIVLHLLGGCRRCRRIAGRLWRLADRPAPALDPLESSPS